MTTATPAQSIALLGPVVLGDCFSLAVWGMLLSNFSHIISTPTWRRASGTTRWTIYVVLLLATFSTALYVHDIWFFSTTSLGNLDLILSGTFVEALELLVLGVVAAIVQVTLTLRASKVVPNETYRWVFVGLTFACITVEFLACVLAEVYQIKYQLNPDAIMNFAISDAQALEIWLTFGAIIDLSISGSYILLLRNKLSGPHSTRRSVSIFRLIVRMTLQSAAYTAVLAVTAAAVTFAYPDYNIATEDIPFAFILPQTNLYAFSLLTTLSVSESVEARLSLKLSYGPALTLAPWGQGTEGTATVEPLPLEAVRKGSNGLKGVEIQVETHKVVDRLSTVDFEQGRGWEDGGETTETSPV